MKDLAFALSVPADPAFRPLAAEAAGKYGESLGLPGHDARALTVSAREAVDRAAGSGSGRGRGRGGEITLEVHREGDQLELTVTGGGESSTMSRSLGATKSN